MSHKVVCVLKIEKPCSLEWTHAMIKDMTRDMPMESFKNALQPQPSTSMFGTLSIFFSLFFCLEFLEEATYSLFEQSSLVPPKPSKFITYCSPYFRTTK